MSTRQDEQTAPTAVSLEATLIESILKGDLTKAAKLAMEMSQVDHESNEVIDAICEAMNIATDLHEVAKYSEEQLEKSERAAESALDAVKGKIKIEQKKLHGRVMVASLVADPHSFERTLMLTMLKACGFTPIDGGTELTPVQLTQAVKSHKPDVLAVPVLTKEAAQQLEEVVPIIRSNGHPPGVVVFGKGAGKLSMPIEHGSVEQDSMGAVSRVTELLITKG